MNSHHIYLEDLFISEQIEEFYAKIIAQEDMEVSYGKTIIIE